MSAMFAMSLDYILNPNSPIVPLDPKERVNQLFQNGKISKEVFEDKESFDFLSSDALQELLKTYPNYKISTLQELKDCIGIQFARRCMTDPAFEDRIAENDTYSQIACRFIKQVFLNHPEAFLHESITKQNQIIKRSILILITKDPSFNAQNLGPFLFELSKINLQEVANFLCSDKDPGGLEYHEIFKYINLSLKSLNVAPSQNLHRQVNRKRKR
jgi:hypothetical protein